MSDCQSLKQNTHFALDSQSPGSSRGTELGILFQIDDSPQCPEAALTGLWRSGRPSSAHKWGSSEEIVGGIGFGQLAK